MKQMTGNEIRQKFLDYFKSKGHMIEPGVSLVPVNDPTLLWINAGVAGLKKYFDGTEKPACNRIANAQKSIRTNDIENVGKTARHHTFFEMLGNFSIGDYFKEEAIPFAWEFLTDEKWMGIDKEKLYVSVYTDDDDAYRIWTDVCKVEPSHILKTDDNFWEIGKGPGGPDSEIFFDRGEKYDPEGLGEKLFFDEMENDRYVEVWNVVFSQYDCNPEIDRKDYKELPQKNIDTGMGLERLTALIQGGETNFDTDLFLPIIDATKQFSKYPYDGEYKMAYRVIADHIRTLVFALSDGANFSNSGRGYVLRRVLRRAARFGLKLGIEEPFLYKLVDVVDENMKDFYPYLKDHAEMNKRLIKNEEESFRKTLVVGQNLLDEKIAEAKAEGKDTLDGAVAFKLYDTYGYPYELTEEIAQESGLNINKDEFDKQMQAQKERARNARKDIDSFASQHEDIMKFTTPSEFVGYDVTACTSKIIALFKDGKSVDSLDGEGQVIFETTCFYAESGGQVGDTGRIESDMAKAKVVDTKKARNGQHLLSVEVEDGVLNVGDEMNEYVDEKRRMATTCNHSCTHLLHSALRKVLGDHIHQAGSFVGPDYLRFDYSHFEKMTPAELSEVEKIVNEYISDGYNVTKVVMDIDEAKKSGATALFNEKYGDRVRVVTMGNVSKEFCAGCHVDNTRQIGVFKIVSEESIGSDARRITAKTGFAAYEDFAKEQAQLENIAHAAKSKGIKDIDTKVANDYAQMKEMQKTINELESRIFALRAMEWKNSASDINGIHYVQKVADMDVKALKEIAASIKGNDDDAVCFLVSNKNGKLVFIASAGKNAVAKGIKAGDMIKLAATATGGKGGGKPDLAQGGGKDAGKLDAAINEVAEYIKKA